MKVAIHQPNFLPWGGYFKKIMTCDKFVLLDDVQFSKNSLINRNQIKTSQGALWITVPVKTTGKSEQFIRETEIAAVRDWKKGHLRSFEQNYRKAPYFEAVFDGILKFSYDRDFTLLGEFNIDLIDRICDYLNVRTDFIKSSEMNIDGKATDRLAAICQNLNADVYIHGGGSQKYHDASIFDEAGIKMQFVDFKNQAYRQIRGEFIPSLSIVDILFNHGPDSTGIILA